MDMRLVSILILVIFGIVFLGRYFLNARKSVFEKQVSSVSPVELETLIPKTIIEIDLLVVMAKNEALHNLRVLLKNNNSKRTFVDTVLFFDTARDLLMSTYNRIDVLTYVHPDPTIVSHAAAAAADLLNFFNQEFMSKQVFVLMNNFANSGATLDPSEEYLLKKILEDLSLSGCALDEEALKKLKQLEHQLVLKSNEFMQNVATDDSKLLFQASELVGVSEMVLANLSKNQDGNFLVGMDYPTYFEIMKNCSCSETRQKMYHMFSNRAYPKNESVLHEVITLRQELSEMLDFSDYASMELHTKMAGTPERVMEFLTKIKDKVLDSVSQEFLKLTADLPLGVEIGSDNLLSPWDYDYLCSYYEKKYLDVDQNKIAEYFPIESTLKAVFSLYEGMLGLRFEIVKDAPTFWHNDTLLIKAYKVVGNVLLGHIILDLYPRHGKYTHACCGSIISGVDNELSQQLPIIFVLANFQKATKNFPSLLKHDEVKTFFHEFGHAMHNLLGRTKYAYFSGTSVLRDFVETPSQMFEEWMYSKEILQQVSCHYITGKSLPDSMISKLDEQRTYTLANWVTRQVRLAMFSLRCYQTNGFSSLKELEEDIAKQVPSMNRFQKEAHFFSSFSHLIGYGAAYYGYLWSLVFAKELWAKILELGISSPASGELIKDLLSAGGMVHPDQLLNKVLGHTPEIAAFENFLNKK